MDADDGIDAEGNAEGEEVEGEEEGKTGGKTGGKAEDEAEAEPSNPAPSIGFNEFVRCCCCPGDCGGVSLRLCESSGRAESGCRRAGGPYC